MEKLNLFLELSLVLKPKGDLRFGQTFFDKVKIELRSLCESTGFSLHSEECTEEVYRFGINLPLNVCDKLKVFVDTLQAKLDILSEGGQDSDLLGQPCLPGRFEDSGDSPGNRWRPSRVEVRHG